MLCISILAMTVLLYIIPIPVPFDLYAFPSYDGLCRKDPGQ